MASEGQGARVGDARLEFGAASGGDAGRAGDALQVLAATWTQLQLTDPKLRAHVVRMLRDVRADAMDRLSDVDPLPCPVGLYWAAIHITGAWLDATAEMRGRLEGCVTSTLAILGEICSGKPAPAPLPRPHHETDAEHA